MQVRAVLSASGTAAAGRGNTGDERCEGHSGESGSRVRRGTVGRCEPARFG